MRENSPRARKDRLLIRELDGELLIYDRRHHRAYYLNHTAARIWRLADGRRSARAIAAEIAPDLPLGEEIVRYALARLSRANLLLAPYVPPERGITRRELVRQMGRLGIAGSMLIALPTIRALVVPTLAQVTTCVPKCRGVPNCTPCHQGNPSGQCPRKVCWGGSCVDRSSTPC